MNAEQNNSEVGLVYPDWPAPNNINAFVTTRQGGFSEPPFDSFNLAQHVDDKPEHVKNNRIKLKAFLPSEPIWLTK